MVHCASIVDIGLRQKKKYIKGDAVSFSLKIWSLAGKLQFCDLEALMQSIQVYVYNCCVRGVCVCVYVCVRVCVYLFSRS